MKKFFLVFLICFLALFTFAQPYWKDISDTRMPRKILPHGDKIWFCGRGGLTCINKLTEDTIYYNHANSAIPFTRIIDMCLDHSGSLWIVSDSRGIACLEGENWSWYHTGNTPLPNDIAVSVAVDSQNNIWFGFEHYLVKYDGSTWQSISLEPMSTILFLPYDIAIDANDRVLIHAEGLWAYDGTNFIQYSGSNSPMLSNYISTIKVLPDGRVWIAHSLFGITVTDFTDWEVYDTLVPGKRLNYVSSFDETSAGHYWLSTTAGDLYYYDGMNWNLQDVLSPVDTLYQVKYLAVDESDQLYISAAESARFDGSDWHLLDIEETGFKGYNVNDILHQEDGSTWIATSYSGIQKFFNNEWSEFTMDDVSYLYSNCVTTDHSGKVIAGLNHSVSSFENGSWYRKNLPPDPYFHSEITAMITDPQNTLWAAEYPGLVSMNASDTVFYSAYHGNFPSMTVECLDIDNEGHLLAGSPAAFNIWNGTSWTSYTSNNSPLPSAHVNDMAVSEDVIWLATGEGLVRFQNNSWEIYTPDNSPLPDARIQAVDKDSNGVLWIISGIDNLVRFNEQTWEVIDYEHSGILNGLMLDLKVDCANNVWIGGPDCGISIYNENGVILGEEEFQQKTSSEENWFTVYPNPCRKSFRINCHFPLKSGKYQLTLSDMCGKILADYPLKSQDQLFQMDGFIETRGTYLVSVQDENGMIIESKILISR